MPYTTEKGINYSFIPLDDFFTALRQLHSNSYCCGSVVVLSDCSVDSNM